jgi:hypothetical protein
MITTITMLFMMKTFLKMKQTTQETWSIIEPMALYMLWVFSGLYEWVSHVVDVVRISIAVNRYWYRCGGNERVSMNIGDFITSDLCYGPSKTIRTTKSDSDFSWKHKQQILNDVYHQKLIGRLVFARRIGEYREHYHEVIDGNSRIIVLYEFFDNQITWNGKRFRELSCEDRITFRNYKIEVEFL